MLYKIESNPICINFVMLSLCLLCHDGLHVYPWLLIGIVLHNLIVPQDFYTSLSISIYDLGDSVFDGEGLAGFRSSFNTSCRHNLLASFLSSTVFSFFSFIPWVGLVGFGSSD